MNKFQFVMRVFVSVFSVVAFSFVAAAQNQHAWVSGVGDDANPCTRTAPCKTFAGTVTKTAINGEIACLDPGAFGPVTITRSVTINCTQAWGSINGATTNGVVVNITNPADTLKSVRLRGVSITGFGTGINGIQILAASNVFLEDVIIDGFTQHGISVETTNGLTKMILNHATVTNNLGNGFNTFIVGGGSAMVSVTKSVFVANNVGFNLSQTVKATLQDSTINGNTTGVQVYSSELALTGCQISLNSTGVQALSGGIIRMAGNTVTSNTNGLAGSTIISSGSNLVSGNTANGAPTSTVPLL
jgi:hypothetical protein